MVNPQVGGSIPPSPINRGLAQMDRAADKKEPLSPCSSATFDGLNFLFLLKGETHYG